MEARLKTEYNKNWSCELQVTALGEQQGYHSLKMEWSQSGEEWRYNPKMMYVYDEDLIREDIQNRYTYSTYGGIL